MQKLMNLICVGNKNSIGLVVFLSTFFGLVACQAGPEVLSAPIMGYNHTPAAINEFTVNGAGGAKPGPSSGRRWASMLWRDSKVLGAGFGGDCRVGN